MKFLFPLLLVLALATVVSGCQNQPNSSASSDVPTVSATIFPVYDLVRTVAGDKLQVELLVPAGASPHTYEPTPSQARVLEQSELVFNIGLGLDDWVIEQKSPDQVVSLDSNIELLQSDHDHEDDEVGEAEHESDHDESDESNESAADPHYWLSVVNAHLMIDSIVAELSEAYPENATEFQSNATELHEQLALIDDTFHQKWCQEPPRIATFHNAWQYLSRDHCVEIVTNFEEFPGEEPTPQYLAEFTKEIQTHQVTAVFSEPQFSAKPLKTLAQDLGVTLSTLDPLGGQGEVQSYAQLMEYNFSQIDQAVQ